MRKTNYLLLGLCISASLFAASGKAYMEKFQAYQAWSEALPTSPTPAFLAFIKGNTPLSQKLRAQWLFQLVRNKDWARYIAYYQTSSNISLQCYALSAQYHLGQQAAALRAAKPLWLNAHSLPHACDELFDHLVQSGSLEDTLITQRILLALDQQHISLVRHLLKQYKPPRVQEANILTDIYLHPEHISQLTPSPMHAHFYLYGLKRLVAINLKKALALWNSSKTQTMLSDPQKQAFLVQVCLFKLSHDHKDASRWFAKIKPAYYNDTLLDLQIRLALKQQRWPYVEYLIRHIHDKENPAWRYWLARSLEAQGKNDQANTLYRHIAQDRHYYGFLASLRSKRNLRFTNEQTTTNLKKLTPYKPFTDQIKRLYLSKQWVTASRLLNDFVMELPKSDKSALAYWLSYELKWYAKSLNLSNATEELNNQLSLRFPLAYQRMVAQYANTYHIPKGLIYAIIRQESTFHDDIVSPAGAHGLMQLMPSTAKIIAKRERIAYSNKQQLFSPPKNINIGTAYLQQLHKRFHHPVLMSAAYNAGPSRVVYWLKHHPPKQIDIWIETLPWKETRNYLKNIIAFYAVYQYRMQEKPNIDTFLRPW
jgi:soluble lytic murein transglycosylase